MVHRVRVKRAEPKYSRGAVRVAQRAVTILV